MTKSTILSVIAAVTMLPAAVAQEPAPAPTVPEGVMVTTRAFINGKEVPPAKAAEMMNSMRAQFRRQLLGKQLPEAYHLEKDAIQQRWITQSGQIRDGDFPAFSRACLEEERAFFEKWKDHPFEGCTCAPGFAARWRRKNLALHRD